MKEIRNILRWHDEMDWRREQAALASVVRVEQSAFRRVGARMLVKSSGEWIGGISGGCLEGDALRRAQAAIFRNTPSRVVYDTLDEADDRQIGIGLGCRGRIEVLFTPIHPEDAQNPIAVLRRQVARREPNILIQLIRHSRQAIDGRLWEATQARQLERELELPAGKLEPCLEEVRQMGQSRIYSFDSAGESFQLLLEWIRPETRLIVAGEHYDVSALAGIAGELGWELHLLGKPHKFNRALVDAALSVHPFEQAGRLPLDDFTAVVLMTHDYDTDLNLIRHFLLRRPRYLGLLGPRKRMERMQDELPSDPNRYSGLFSPVGLDLGAESPEEIGLAIAAEILAAFRDREGRPLKYRKGSIHERP